MKEVAGELAARRFHRLTDSQSWKGLKGQLAQPVTFISYRD